MKALNIIKQEAREVVDAIHHNNSFYSLEEATARFNAVCNMAIQLNLVTQKEINKIKAEVKHERNR